MERLQYDITTVSQMCTENTTSMTCIIRIMKVEQNID